MILSSMLALTLAGANPAAECVPAPKAGHAGAHALAWVINNDAVTFRGKKYMKYGLPRVLYAGEVELVGPYKGGYFYAEKGVKDYEILYLLTRLDGCEFQPYYVPS